MSFSNVWSFSAHKIFTSSVRFILQYLVLLKAVINGLAFWISSSLLLCRKNWFLCVDLVIYNLAKFTSSSRFLVDSSEFSIRRIMSSANIVFLFLFFLSRSEQFWPGLLAQCWTAAVKVGILVLFLILRENFWSFTTTWIFHKYHVEEFLSYS